MVFTVIRSCANVRKAYLCLGCYELLVELMPGGVSSVSPEEYLETAVTPAGREDCSTTE